MSLFFFKPSFPPYSFPAMMNYIYHLNRYQPYQPPEFAVDYYPGNAARFPLLPESCPGGLWGRFMQPCWLIILIMRAHDYIVVHS